MGTWEESAQILALGAMSYHVGESLQARETKATRMVCGALKLKDWPLVLKPHAVLKCVKPPPSLEGSLLPRRRSVWTYATIQVESPLEDHMPTFDQEARPYRRCKRNSY